MKKKYKLNRKSIEFEYEFADGTSATFEYLEPTTEQIEESFNADGLKAKVEHAKEVLIENLKSDDISHVDKLINEQTKYGNLYELKVSLDEELGNVKKRG